MEELKNYDQHIKSKLAAITSSKISDRNKQAILEFKDECFARGLGKGRVLKYLHNTSTLAGWLNKDFHDCTKQDIKALVARIEQSKYANSTKKEFKIVLKKLFKWLRDQDEGYPAEVNWIIPGSKSCENNRKLPEDMLTEDEVQRLIQVASGLRNKAFISMLYESGCRISELLLMRLRSIQFDEHGAKINVPAIKTGSRRIRIVLSVPLLTAWMDNHPFKDNADSFLWIDNRMKRLGYGSASALLKRLAKKAGIKKKVNPHNFRHSRATYMANHLTEAQMKEYFGWIQGSDMAAIYVHLSGRDVDNAVLKIYGRSSAEQSEESILTPKICNRCQQQNPSNNRFCSRCGIPLDSETLNTVIKNDLERKHADSIMDRLLNDPKFRTLFDEKLKEISPQ